MVSMLQCSGCNLILKIYIIQQSGFQPAADESALMDELPIGQNRPTSSLQQQNKMAVFIQCILKLYFPMAMGIN